MSFCQKFLLSFGLSLALSLAFTSCDDDLATSPSDQPTFSVDTLHIGTLLCDNSSKTYLVKLYNHSSGELKISSIALRHAETSGFRMNVDGMNGTSFTNSDLLRVAKGDSMFIFVEATFPPDGELSTYHTDYIDILCNNRSKTIVLDAYSKDVAKLYGVVLDKDSIWPQGAEAQIYDSLVIPQGVTLVLSDSTTLYLHDKANIYVRGTLICEGKLGAPVTIRGDRTDKMFDNLPYDNLPSQWGSLYIDSTAQGCSFNYTDIHGMSDGIWIDSTDVVFNSCRIKNSDGNLLTCHMSQMKLYNSELSNAAGALLDIYGGWHDVVHCTLANYNFAKVVSTPALQFTNFDTAQVRLTPLHHCLFQNTIVWGKWHDPDVYPLYYRVVVDTDRLGRDVYADSIFTYRFEHCLLRAAGFDDDDFVRILWNNKDTDNDPKYMLIDTPNYTFDFHLLEDSPARGAGKAEGALLCPTNLDGEKRPEIPDIGCY